MVAANLANMRIGDNQHSKEGAQIFATSNSEAAEKLNVSERTVNSAKKVQQHGIQELQAKVEDGLISVSAAADVATLSKEEQQEVVAKGEHEILAKAKEIRTRKAKKRRADNKKIRDKALFGRLRRGWG